MVTQEDVLEIEQYFASTNLPKSIKTKDGFISNVKQYVESHMNILRSHDTLNAYEGYYHNLVALKTSLNGKI